MMFYIRTADKLTRTAPWLDNMEGGIDYLRSVIIDDKLGLNDHLEEELARLRAAFACEWTETVNNSGGGADPLQTLYQQRPARPERSGGAGT